MVKFLNGLTMKASAAVMAGALAMIPLDEALASSTDLKSMTEQVGNQSAQLPQMFNTAFYICGFGLCGLGIYGMKKHVDNPGQEKLPPALGKIGFGGAMAATPFLLENALKTAGLDSGSQAALEKVNISPF